MKPRQSGDPRRWPLGLIGAILLAALIEWGIHRRAIDFRSSMQWDWMMTRHAAAGVGGARVLCLGDSLAKEGVLPPILESRLKVRVRTLAINAGHPTAHRALFERAIASGARPATVVIELEPWLLRDGLVFNGPNWPVLLGTRRAIGLARAMRDAGFLAGWCAAQLPSVRSRDEVRRLASSTLRGGPPVNRLMTAPLLRNWRANQGAQVVEATTTFDGRLTDEHIQWFPPKLTPDAACRADLDPLLSLLADDGRRVFWLLPPVSHVATARRRADGLSAEQDALVAAIRSRHPTITVIDARGLGLGDEAFHDPFHLNRAGATELTTRLASAIAEPSVGGFVDLSRVAPAATQPTARIETLAESRRIVADRLRR